MSAATVFPEVKDAHLQNLLFALLTSTRSQQGTLYAGFTDRLGQAVPANSQAEGGGTNTTSQAGPTREVQVVLTVNPDGLSCTVKIQPLNATGLQAVIGQLDTATLAGQISV